MYYKYYYLYKRMYLWNSYVGGADKMYVKKFKISKIVENKLPNF